MMCVQLFAGFGTIDKGRISCLFSRYVDEMIYFSFFVYKVDKHESALA